MWFFLWMFGLLLLKPSCYTGPVEYAASVQHKCMEGFYPASIFNNTMPNTVQKLCCFSYLDYLVDL